MLDTVDLFGIKVLQQLCGKPNKHVIVLEFGNWDLRHTPLRNFLFNPSTFPTFLRHLEDMLKRKECQNIEIVWVQSAPHHVCMREDPNCLHELDHGWSNNYAIAAMNQYVAMKLLNYSYLHGEDRVRIVDRYDQLFPRLNNEEYNCKGNSFICSRDSQIVPTASIRAVTSEILGNSLKKFYYYYYYYYYCYYYYYYY